MPFQVSPGVNISEIDLTTVAPAVSSTEGAIAGVFAWGPVDQRVLVDSESTLLERFGKPSQKNKETWFTAASFLTYGNSLYVVRTANTTDSNTTNSALNAIVTTTANVAGMSDRLTFTAKNQEDYDNKRSSGAYTNNTTVSYMAKWPGQLGNSLEISQCDSATAYESTIDLTAPSTNTTINGYITSNTVSMTAEVGNNVVRIAMGGANLTQVATALDTVKDQFIVSDNIVLGNNTIGTSTLQVASVGNNSSNATHAFFDITMASKYKLSTNYTTTDLKRRWKYYDVVDSAPGTSYYQSTNPDQPTRVDEVHVVVADKNGSVTGVPGTILEVYEAASRSTNAKTEDGATNYYKNIINTGSKWMWALNDVSGATTAGASTLAASTNVVPMVDVFEGGTDGLDESDIAMADLLRGYDFFTSAEDVDVSLVMQGKARGGTNGEQLANYIIDNICEVRKDCVAFISPAQPDVVRNEGNELDDILEFKSGLSSSSYAVMDSGYKYMYDKYNDVYRNIPLNGDIAGLAVYTDSTRDPWFSPAGFSRGQIKNIVRLSYNPNKAERDVLYKNSVNPIVTFPGKGTVMFGDKTLLNRPSAFDRINVRRLFIVLEKAIARAAQTTLFEFNDEFTRAQFKNLVDPFLRDVQGRRGIYAYKVVVDETNNTAEVIDRNEFIGDIYIKPAKSINFIQLNFVAVRTGVEFSEVVGNF